MHWNELARTVSWLSAQDELVVTEWQWAEVTNSTRATKLKKKQLDASWQSQVGNWTWTPNNHAVVYVQHCRRRAGAAREPSSAPHTSRELHTLVSATVTRCQQPAISLSRRQLEDARAACTTICAQTE